MWWDPRNAFPIFADRNNEEDNGKEDESYHVYVNGEHIGDKHSVAQGDGGPYAVQDYLQSRGFQNFDIQLEGDHIHIQTQGGEQSEDMKKHLSVYLNMR